MNCRQLFRGMITVVLCLAAVISTGRAQTTWYVDDNAPDDPGAGDPTVSDPLEDGTEAHPFDAIQEGVDAASTGDTVRVAPGTYRGAGNIEIDFHGKGIEIRGGQDWYHSCVIDCEYSGRAFYFHTNETNAASVWNLSITHFSASSAAEGAVTSIDASPRFLSCGFRNCEGSAFYSEGGAPVIGSCTFSRNTGDVIHCKGGEPWIAGRYIEENWGRVIYCEDADVRIESCEITANVSCSGSHGVIDCRNCDVTVVDCVISRNAGAGWGGIAVISGKVLIDRCEISHNLTLDEYCGGAISLADVEGVILNSRIEWNLGGWIGGGFNSEQCDCSIVNCVFARNETLLVGGAICSWSDRRMAISNCTIVDNLSEDAVGGIYCEDMHGDLTMLNCIVRDNVSEYPVQIGCGAGEDTTASASIAFCDIQGERDSFDSNGNVVLDWGPGNFDADPLFVDGPFGDYRLAAGSPCIDVGCNCGMPEDSSDLDGDGAIHEFVPYDLENQGRFFDDPDTPDPAGSITPVVDIGAYEYGGSTVPPVLGDLNGDRSVTLDDLAVLLAHYGLAEIAEAADGDLNCDGNVDLDDLAGILARYGQGAPG